YRMVSGVDRNIGRILAALDQLSLAANTVVLFASDHGMYYGDRGLSDCWQLNEQSIRIPLIVFDPRADESKRGIVREEMALNIDVAPTILELAGLDAADGMQGKSLVPLLRGKEAEWRKAFFCEHRFDRADIPKSEGLRTQRWKYIRYYEQQPVYEELYDLLKDPHESCNLAADSKFADQLARLRRRCDASLFR
ncbi:MAG: sulfatase-like hydrolase/transferase, partial [Gemmatimonadetes bacterium]|nr:sulfatase-like hydrolase/transferase [Gemmatimonadota bacterium]